MAENSSRGLRLRLMYLAVATSAALPAVMFVWAGYANYQKIVALADERIVRSLDVEQEHAAKSFQIVNLILDDVTEDLLAEPFEARPRFFYDLFTKRVKAVSEIQSIWLYDKDGNAVATSSTFPAPRRNYADQDFFRAHIAKDVGNYFGELHTSTFGGQPFFTIGRRLTRNGAFAGVIAVSVLPSDFYRFYTRLAYGEGLQYALLKEDGVFLVRYPIPDKVPPTPLGPNTGFRKTIAESKEGGFYNSISPVDNIERRYGVRRLAVGPLYLSAGVTKDAINDEWFKEMFPYFFFGVPGAILLCGSLVFLLLGTRRLNIEMDRREMAEGALRQAQRLDAIGHLTGGVAHDFNNLLTIIIGNLESAQRQAAGLSDAAKDRLVTTVNRAMQGAQRAATLTKRLLAFSRQQPLNPTSLDLNKLLHAFPDLIEGGLEESIEVEVVGAGGLWSVEADATELETAILNLAVNARDAMPNGGKLTIEANNSYLDDDYCRANQDVRPGQYVMISVSDTGTGMSPDVVQRAFEPFFTTKDAGQGTGLGLSQVYGFVKQSGGHIKIYSEAGEGTTIKIYLPRLTGTAAAQDTPVAEVASNASGERILLVEDDDDVRAYLAETLRAANYAVVEAANGEKALEALETTRGHFDLLLTDVVMPGMNGRHLAEEMKVRRPDTKVLFMTGYSRNAIVHHGRLDAGVELVQKPITGDRLIAKIRAILDKVDA